MKQPNSPAEYPVTGIVLAAGMSRRMGGANKLLLTVGQTPMVRRVVNAVLESRCTHVLVVLGHQAEEVRASLSDLPVQFVLNSEFTEGLASSVRAGANAVRDARAVVFCLGDMPLVSAAVIDRLIEAYDPTAGMVACQSSFRGRRGNPVLWSSTCLEDLRHLRGDEGGRSLMRRYAGSVATIEMDSSSVLMDIDTLQDLSNVPGEDET